MRATVEGLTWELAERWRDDAITVMAAAAGHFRTEAINKYPKSFADAAARTVPLQRLGRPEEHGWLVALLLSPVAHAFNGPHRHPRWHPRQLVRPWPPRGLADDDGTVPTEDRSPPTAR